MNDMEFEALKTQARRIAGRTNYVQHSLAKLEELKLDLNTMLTWVNELINKELKKHG